MDCLDVELVVVVEAVEVVLDGGDVLVDGVRELLHALCHGGQGVADLSLLAAHLAIPLVPHALHHRLNLVDGVLDHVLQGNMI